MSKLITLRLYRYDNILLSTYIEIAQSGNLHLLIISGFPTDQELENAWEVIVKTNAKVNGNSSLDSYHNNLKSYGKLIAEYELSKLYLMQLILVVDNEAIMYLNTKGYRINTTSSSKYVESINVALQRSNHYLTRMKMKLNEIIMSKEEMVNGGNNKGMEEVLANISAIVGFNIDTNITLAKFNEYRRIAKIKTERRPKRTA